MSNDTAKVIGFVLALLLIVISLSRRNEKKQAAPSSSAQPSEETEVRAAGERVAEPNPMTLTGNRRLDWLVTIAVAAIIIIASMAWQYDLPREPNTLTDEQIAFLAKVFEGRIYPGVLGVIAIMLAPLRRVAFWAVVVGLAHLGVFLELGFGVAPSADPALHGASASGLAAGRLVGFSLFGVATASVAYGLKRLALWPITGSRFYVKSAPEPAYEPVFRVGSRIAPFVIVLVIVLLGRLFAGPEIKNHPAQLAAKPQAAKQSLVSDPAPELMPGFKRMDLRYGFSIDLPENWKVLGQEDIKNANKLSDFILGPEKEKETLLAANVLADNPMDDAKIIGAQARVSVSPANGLTQADIKSLEEHDATLTSLTEAAKQGLIATGVRVRKMEPLRIGVWGEDRAVVVAYRRAGASGFGMNVIQYHIPTRRFRVMLTLSYLSIKKSELEPVIKRVRDSFRYPK